MSPYLRTARTWSGATALRIVHSSHRGWRLMRMSSWRSSPDREQSLARRARWTIRGRSPRDETGLVPEDYLLTGMQIG